MARAPRRRRARRGSRVELREETVALAGVELRLLRPASPDALIDEEAFAADEFLPYWAELWPAAVALAEALPEVAGLRVVELGCGLGLPSLVAAARGADVTAVDWAEDAIALLRQNAARNGLQARAAVRDWREPWTERFDLALAADVLYERRNVEPVLARLRELAPESLVGLAGRPYEHEFLRLAGDVEQLAPRVVRLRQAPGVQSCPC
ncbi:MAG TPA: methyltransferase domain-containing protein [Gaiellaceae bacterium]|nr:methyltransferase domain-containing protein [Gaiellaceae bacterium]